MNRLLPTRRLIPRWRKAKFSVNQLDMLGMVKSSTSKVTVAAPSDEVDRELHAWKRTGSVAALADVLAFGVDPQQHERLVEAARVAIVSEASTPTMRLVAREIIESGSSKSDVWQKPLDARHSVQVLRALLRSTPNDVIALVDLAQHHLAHGKRQAVERAWAQLCSSLPTRCTSSVPSRGTGCTLERKTRRTHSSSVRAGWQLTLG